LWSRTLRALSSFQRLASVSCSGPTTRTLPCPSPAVVQPMGMNYLIPSIAQCSLLLRWALPVPGAGFYKRMRSCQHKKRRTAQSPPEFVFCRHWPAAGERQPGPFSGKGKGWGLPIPIGLHKGNEVEKFHIVEPKGSTSVRDRSMSRRLVSAASNSTYALCSGSLIRKIELGWESTI